jgi:hypothetical protein
MQLISGFIDTYLKLNQAETPRFQTELNLFNQEEQKEVMQIVTSWMQQGIEQGIEQDKELVLRNLLIIESTETDLDTAAEILQNQGIQNWGVYPAS